MLVERDFHILELLVSLESTLHVLAGMNNRLAAPLGGQVLTEDETVAALRGLEQHGLVYSYREQLLDRRSSASYATVPEYGAKRRKITWWGRTKQATELLLMRRYRAHGRVDLEVDSPEGRAQARTLCDVMAWPEHLPARGSFIGIQAGRGGGRRGADGTSYEVLYEGGVCHVVVGTPEHVVLHDPHPRCYAAAVLGRGEPVASTSGVVIDAHDMYVLELLDDAESTLFILQTLVNELDGVPRQDAMTEEWVTGRLRNLQRAGLVSACRESLPEGASTVSYADVPEYGTGRREIIWWARTGAALEIVLRAAHARQQIQ